MNKLLEKALPHLSTHRPFPKGAGDQAAFWIGTGLGSGLMRPASGTWGSLVGMGYLYLWALLPNLAVQIAVYVAGLVLGVWSADRCETFFGLKDPKSVVIDEIAVVPVAFYPLLHAGETRWWVWVVAFVIYRLMDIVKWWPGRRLEALGGGLGIMADDVMASLYTCLALWGLEHVRI